jgi:hypothetical protein
MSFDNEQWTSTGILPYLVAFPHLTANPNARSTAAGGEEYNAETMEAATLRSSANDNGYRCIECRRKEVHSRGVCALIDWSLHLCTPELPSRTLSQFRKRADQYRIEPNGIVNR